MGLPGSIKRWLEKNPWYIRVRYARPVLDAWLWLRPSVRKSLAAQKKMYLSFLTAGNDHSQLVFDIGANEGFLTGIFVGAGYSVIAVEPSQRNIAILKRRFRNNPNVKIVEAAVNENVGEVLFHEAGYDHALGTASQKWKSRMEKSVTGGMYPAAPVLVKADTLDHLIQMFGEPSFIKIDVEGFEESALKGLTKKVSLLSFEAILPDFIEETRNCIAHLDKLGGATVYNFASNDQLQWDEFKGSGPLITAIEQLPPQTIEIFCKM